MVSSGRNGLLMALFSRNHRIILLLSLVTTTTSFLGTEFIHRPILPRCRSFSDNGSNRQAVRTAAPSSSDKVEHLTHIDRVLCISDLHTDHVDNMRWLRDRTNSSSSSFENLTSSDLIVVAGDISHELTTLEKSLTYLLQHGSSVLFVPGNHEGWLNAKQSEDGNSLEKLRRVYETCHRLGVLTGCTMVGGTADRPHALWLGPLESWYDGSLAIEGCEDLCDDFGSWPWVDFIRCRWPDFPPIPDGPNKRIPSGLTEYFHKQNHHILDALQHSIQQSNIPGSRAVMTVSHFLPNKQCLPDWKDVESSEFSRDSWLDHGASGVSAKFAKVAGTMLLDDQIRSYLQIPDDMRRMHLFGHSHRPKDFEMGNIRYIHNPLGKPRERDCCMVSPEVDFQTVWDTKSGEVPGETVIRFWEEKGGGVEKLKERMANSRRRSRYSQRNA